ncbi:MAG: hypothetical protein ABGX05_04800, partial [Pirellulaceae bacterium]
MKQHDFQAPAVQANRLEDPLTFRHEADASAVETISSLLQQQGKRLEVAADQVGLASEAALSHADMLGTDPLSMIGDAGLASWTSEGAVSVCGSGDVADSADSTLSDTSWHVSERDQSDMQTQFNTDDTIRTDMNDKLAVDMVNWTSLTDMQKVEKQATSLNQSAAKASASETSSSSPLDKRTSFGG